ncbi:hypothetical protein [Flavobacterium urocaniciphilum]|uniref:Uncharacterized protein n=1 Tax=Flavobacterium urocaniciphilum TaxID=1299341 RepID=A0A1H9DF00_9FLAO|nr:hypothetical protein [Flavobacterium urocaniciphilum]SEQ11961.1 hypothetical protein SAMN05444005_1075 [Flavobacterium urocaniciphilum]
MKNLILLFLFSINLISAQNSIADSIVTNQIKIFKESKIEEFFILEKYCNGCKLLTNLEDLDCDLETSHIYIFWKEKDESYYQKISKCRTEKTKISFDIFANYSSKIDIIKDENVKNYQTEKSDFISISHSEFSTFYFISNSNQLKKSFDHFDLTSNENNPNINAEYNKSLELVKLSYECDNIILKK